MHHHLEIVMPAVKNVEAAIEQILHPFDENNDEAYRPFWDWYVIGGRWAGAKMEARLGADRLDAFNAELASLKLTVSGLQWGKPELSPGSQIPEVDALWWKHFPELQGQPCSIFQHSNDNKTPMAGDISTLKETPLTLTAAKVIFAAPGFLNSTWADPDEKVEAESMFSDEVYNGCNYERTVWDCTLGHAIQMHLGKLERMSEEAKARYAPQDDWLVVTVDYHS